MYRFKVLKGASFVLVFLDLVTYFSRKNIWQVATLDWVVIPTSQPGVKLLPPSLAKYMNIKLRHLAVPLLIW